MIYYTKLLISRHDVTSIISRHSFIATRWKCVSLNKKLSCPRKTSRCFVSLN